MLRKIARRARNELRRLWNRPKLEGDRIHVGCGTAVFEGWVNLDLRPLPGVIPHDVRDGIPLDQLEFIYAEHFLEHLTWNEGARFLSDCRRALRDDGVLRISTPNLDWVWAMQYHPYEWESADEQIRDCFWMNKSFRGWGHQFIYNRATLEAALRKAGFAEITHHRYGESNHEQLRGRESHETYRDTPEIPHVIVMEATGRAQPGREEQLEQSEADFLEAVEA
ncbi:MAG: hypothetical protein KY459_12280 [Acidobacteria bacterium]|nr:hypothetical protein [Acidobacteriota bacterium]